MTTIEELREHAEDMRCSLNLAPYAKTNDKAAAELEALTKEVERLKQLHTTDMRVTNESADFHMKRCDQLRTQNRELREALLNVLGVTQHWAGCGAWTNGPCDCVRLVITKALAQTEVKL